MSKNLQILVLLVFLGAGLEIQGFNKVFAQTAYWARCEHGGYYLTREHDYQKALDGNFELLDSLCFVAAAVVLCQLAFALEQYLE